MNYNSKSFDRVMQTPAVASRDERPDAVEDSIMIAFYPPPEKVANIPQTVGVDKLHITLMLLDEDITDYNKLELISTILRGFCDTRGAVSAIMNKTDVFWACEDDGRSAYHAVVESPGLKKFRQELLEKFQQFGIKVNMKHPDYQPHMTLGYLAPGETPKTYSFPGVIVYLDTLSLCWGDDHYEFLLENKPDPLNMWFKERRASAVSHNLRLTFR